MNFSSNTLNSDKTTHVDDQLEFLKTHFEKSLTNQREKILSLAKEKSTQKLNKRKLELSNRSYLYRKDIWIKF